MHYGVCVGVTGVICEAEFLHLEVLLQNLANIRLSTTVPKGYLALAGWWGVQLNLQIESTLPFSLLLSQNKANGNSAPCFSWKWKVPVNGIIVFAWGWWSMARFKYRQH